MRPWKLEVIERVPHENGSERPDSVNGIQSSLFLARPRVLVEAISRSSANLPRPLPSSIGVCVSIQPAKSEEQRKIATEKIFHSISTKSSTTLSSPRRDSYDLTISLPTRLEYPVQLSSNNPTLSRTPHSLKASQTIPAVIPLPQLAVIDSSPLSTRFQRSSPRVSRKILMRSARGRRVE